MSSFACAAGAILTSSNAVADPSDEVMDISGWLGGGACVIGGFDENDDDAFSKAAQILESIYIESNCLATALTTFFSIKCVAQCLLVCYRIVFVFAL